MTLILLTLECEFNWFLWNVGIHSANDAASHHTCPESPALKSVKLTSVHFLKGWIFLLQEIQIYLLDVRTKIYIIEGCAKQCLVMCVKNFLNDVILIPTGGGPHSRIYHQICLSNGPVGSEVFTALNMMITVLWDMETYWLVICNQWFGGACCQNCHKIIFLWSPWRWRQWGAPNCW